EKKKNVISQSEPPHDTIHHHCRRPSTSSSFSFVRIITAAPGPDSVK
ncbi:hypothetical protein A2U01_0000918, partial [Trifolium medium]|nr:hypothetical protein [Trifolium medium]